MFLSSLRCVPAPIFYIFLPFIPHWLRRSAACVLRWPPLRGVVPGLGALCSWCSSVPAGGASGCWVPGETGRSARQTSRSVLVQVPAWLTKGRAVSTHLLECSPDARSVWPQLRWGYGRQPFRTCLQRKLSLFIHFRTTGDTGPTEYIRSSWSLHLWEKQKCCRYELKHYFSAQYFIYSKKIHLSVTETVRWLCLP